MSYEVIYSEWEHPNPGQYLRDDGAEVLRTGLRTWTLSHPLYEDTRHRTARAAKSHADTL